MNKHGNATSINEVAPILTATTNTGLIYSSPDAATLQLCISTKTLQERSIQPTHDRRRVNNIISFHDRIIVLLWMIANNVRTGTAKRMKSKPISQLPTLRRSGNSANLMRSKRFWKELHTLISSLTSGGAQGGMLTSVSHVSRACKKIIRSKARVGRTRK